jgi:V/A-type H+-transporting ATPase subunit F
MVDEIEKYKDMRIPAIIPIPGMDGSYGVGIANLKKAVERAVGADILFGNK